MGEGGIAGEDVRVGGGEAWAGGDGCGVGEEGGVAGVVPVVVRPDY